MRCYALALLMAAVLVGCTPTADDRPTASVSAQPAAATPSPDTPQTIPTAAPADTPAPPASDLALLSAACQPDTVGFMTCSGAVKNLTDGPLEHVEAVIEWYDAADVLQTNDDALIEYDPLLAGQTSPWKVIGRYNPALVGYRVTFKSLFGAPFSVRYDR